MKFSLGLYRQYEYLKILNVGLEPGTHVVLPSKRIKQALEWEKGQQISDLISDLLNEIHHLGPKEPKTKKRTEKSDDFLRI